MRRYLRFGIILLGFALIGACEEYLGPSVDCDDCFWEKPDSADLVIYLTINEQHPEVPIVLYRGEFDNHKVDWVDTARESPFYIYSAMDQFYSVTAEYKVDGKTILAVDGDNMKAKFVSEGCDYNCWIVKGGYLKTELNFE